MKCELCDSTRQDEIQFGPFLIRYDKAAHLNCLILSNGLKQRGAGNVDFNGYLLRDITSRRRYFYKQNCCYCNKRYANLKCANKHCQRLFHFICGIENRARNQYVEPYFSYCHQHVTKPKNRPKPTEFCCICYENLFDETKRFCPVTMLRSPCCRNNWFHKLCIQKFALEGGRLFRCPICNNTEEFRKSMLMWGVFTHDEPTDEEIFQEHINHVIDLMRPELFEPDDEDEPVLLPFPINPPLERNPNFNHGYNNGYDGDDYYYDYDDYYHDRFNNYHSFQPPNDDSKGFCIGLNRFSCIINNVLCHPFVILQQQSQINVVSKSYHILPFSLVPIIRKLYRQQGCSVFWKGFFECLCLKGVSLLFRNLHFFDEMPIIYVGFKGVLAIIMFVLKVNGLMMTVGTLKLPNDNIFDCSTKFWPLFFIYLSLEFTKWTFSALVKKITRARFHNKSTERRIIAEDQECNIQSDLVTRIITETVFYPCETVLHRMLLQNTNTIIDNLDTGTTVMPIFTYFKGTKDCFKTTVCMEGYKGLYKGFGGLILQFAVHATIVKIVKWLS